jgi:glycosyltransferase involved in cell wall biosynthesis
MKDRKRILLIAYHYYPDPAVGAKRIDALVDFLEKNGFDLTVLTKKLSTGSENKRRRYLHNSSKIVSVYQHPGLINPAWLWLKKQKAKVRNTESSPEKPCNTLLKENINNKANSGTLSNTTFSGLKISIKRLVISTQSIFDAKKSWLTLALFKLLLLKLKGERYDLIISSGPPTASHVIAIHGRALMKSPWIMETRDPINVWEEVYPLCKANFRVKIEDWYESLFYKKSDKVIVTTPSLGKDLEINKSVDPEKLNVIYNGFDGHAIEQRKKIVSRVRIVYAGSLYLNRNPFNFLDAVRLINEKSDPGFRNFFVEFYGDCDEYNSVNLRNWVRDNGLTNVISIMGTVDEGQLQEIYHNSDILLNFAQNQKKQIPAKTFEYLKYDAISAVITESDSDVSKVLNNLGLGVILEDDIDAIYGFLSEYLKRPDSFSKRKDYSKRIMFSRAIQNDRYLSVLNEVLRND